jgi:hypothetical protein
MLSHYAVHAVMRGLAVVFTADAPRVGDTLKANTDTPNVDYHSMARGLSYAMGEKLEMDTSAKRVKLSAFAAHQTTGLMRSPDGCLAIGLGIGYLIRTATAAVLGEARHGRRHQNGPKAIPVMAQDDSRNEVYRRALVSYSASRRQLTKTWNLFHNGKWSCGFGGRRWSNVTSALIALDSAALRFVHGPNQETFQNAVTAYHTLLNAVHNGGSWVGKFVAVSMLDRAAKGEISLILEAAYATHPLTLQARAADVLAWSTKSLARPKLGKPSTLQVYISAGYIHFQFGIPHNYVAGHFKPSAGDYAVLEGMGEVATLKSFEPDGTRFFALSPTIIDKLSPKFHRQLEKIITGKAVTRE